jgi:amidase
MTATKVQYTEARQRHENVLKIIDQFFQEFDLWMLPVSPSAAILRTACGKPISTPQGKIEYSRYLGAYTIPTTMYGTPVLTCPIGKDHDGMPIGMQIHGARFSDVRLVQLVECLGLSINNEFN